MAFLPAARSVGTTLHPSTTLQALVAGAYQRRGHHKHTKCNKPQKAHILSRECPKGLKCRFCRNRNIHISMSDTILFSASLRNSLGNRTAWGNLPAAARALAIAEAALQHQGLSLGITRDTAEADRLEQELRFFAPQLPVTSFPDW